MGSRHLSIRVDDKLVERLDAEANRSGQSRSELAKTFIEEGLRMLNHSRIFFQDGPSGRRAKLLHGMDVWQLIPVLADPKRADEKAIKKVAKLTGLHSSQVEDGLRYYLEFPEEIDERIRRNDELAERRYAEWQRQQDALAE